MKQYKVRIGGRDYEVAVNGIGQDGIADVTVNGKALKVDTLSGTATARKASTMSVTPSGSAAAPSQEAPSANTAAPAAPSASSATRPATAKASSPAAGTAVASPLPGVIVDVCVKEGDKVQRGQAVAVLEAMKMENSIEAEKSGTVTAVHVVKGDSVQAGAPIVTIA